MRILTVPVAMAIAVTMMVGCDGRHPCEINPTRTVDGQCVEADDEPCDDDPCDADDFEVDSHKTANPKPKPKSTRRR